MPNAKADAWLRKNFGVSEASLEKAFETDSDWTLVIKLHTYIEASLNHLILRNLGEPRLEEVISRLDVGDRRRGKLAFIEALELLPVEYIFFIRTFSEIRNQLAHHVKNVNFDLAAYMEAMDAQRFKKLASSIAVMRHAWLGSFFGVDTPRSRAAVKTEPRYAILHATIAIVYRAYQKDQNDEMIRRMLFG